MNKVILFSFVALCVVSLVAGEESQKKSIEQVSSELDQALFRLQQKTSRGASGDSNLDKFYHDINDAIQELKISERIKTLRK